MRTFQSLEEEARASQEEDCMAIRDLKYWEVDCELWVANLLDFDALGLRGTIVVG